ncbi:MAG: RNA 2',3'-cyclic phosphodiesterase [Deltaproteobacteria bacterium]|nr:RNA 2',3'-cyclic phosphodiesterase [Deltaproteobacteria bacterium]
MSERMRCFVAVRFSDELVASLDDLTRALRRKLDPHELFKWVAADKIHLTLQFLGDVDAGLVPKLAGGLSGAFADIGPFEVALAGAGAFPSASRPRVLWTAVHRGADGLKALHSATVQITEGFGFEPEQRPFQPHATLARLRRKKKAPDLSKEIAGFADRQAGGCQIGAVDLIRSQLRPDGPVYTTLDSFPLGR